MKNIADNVPSISSFLVAKSFNIKRPCLQEINTERKIIKTYKQTTIYFNIQQNITRC